MKRVTLIAAALLAAVGLASCNSDVSSTPESASTSTPVESTAPSETAEEPSEPSEEAEPVQSEVLAEGDVGDYHVKVNNVWFDTDSEGNTVAVVDYDFTNNSADTTSAVLSIGVTAFQNGVETDTAAVNSVDGFDSMGIMKDVKTGGTVNCQYGFILSDNSDVEFEITDIWDFMGESTPITFTIPVQ